MITASTLISGKFGLLSSSVPGAGGCGAQEPAQSSTMGSILGRKGVALRVEGIGAKQFRRGFRAIAVAGYAI